MYGVSSLTDKLRFDSDELLSRDFIFIVGAPRSGTSWLQTMIAAHPQVASSVELTLFDCYLAPWFQRWSEESEAITTGKWHQGLPVVWSQEEFDDFITEFLRRVYSRVLAFRPSATHILDKQPNYAFHVNHIARYLPRSRFIHIIRDGRDVAASWLAARRDMGFGALTMHQAAKDWKAAVTAARQASQYEGRYMEIRYERLLSDTPSELAKLLIFCDLPISEELVTEIVREHDYVKMKSTLKTPVSGIKAPAAHFRKGRVGSWDEDLTNAERFEFDRTAGDLLCELGYAAPDWRHQSLYDCLLTIGYRSKYVLGRLLRQHN